MTKPLANSPLSERQINSGLRINIIAGCLGMMWLAVAMGIPLTMFLEALGASGVQIGLAVTVQQIALIVQIPSALIAERLRTRKRFWASTCIVQRLVWLVPALLPLWLYDRPDQMVVWTIGLVAFSALLIQMSSASWWSWMADLVPENRRGRFWGMRQSIITAAHLLAVWCAGYLLDIDFGTHIYRGFQMVFMLAAILGALDIIIHLGVPEPAPVKHPAVGILKALTTLFKNADFRWLTLSMGWWTLGLSFVGQYTFLYLRRDFGVSYSELALTVVSASLGVVVFGVIWGYVMDRLGGRTFALLTMTLAPLFGVVWLMMRPGDVEIAILGMSVSLPQPVLVLLIMNFFAGAVYSGVGLSQVSLIGAVAPAKGRTIAMAVHWSCVGLMAAVGPIGAGWVMDYVTAHPLPVMLPMGIPFAFMHALALGHAMVTWVLAVPCLYRLSQSPGDVSVRTAATRLFPINPMRALGSMGNIVILSSPRSSKHVARAARRVGEKRGAIAVRDLIGRVDDPNADVRDEAILALGRLQAPEAVDELICRMSDPDGDALPVVARALRKARDPRSVNCLVARLGDADRETVTEAARALGEIGDRSAANALLGLLRSRGDIKITMAASDALSRLGEISAAAEICVRMLSTPSAVQRASLAISVADLLGEPGEFYKHFSRERRDRAAGFHALVQETRAQMKRSRKAFSVERRLLLQEFDAMVAAYEHGNLGATLAHLSALAPEVASLRDIRQTGGPVAADLKSLMAARFLGLLAEQPSHDLRDVDLMLGIYLLCAGNEDAP